MAALVGRRSACAALKASRRPVRRRLTFSAICSVRKWKSPERAARLFGQALGRIPDHDRDFVVADGRHRAGETDVRTAGDDLQIIAAPQPGLRSCWAARD